MSGSSCGKRKKVARPVVAAKAGKRFPANCTRASPSRLAVRRAALPSHAATQTQVNTTRTIMPRTSSAQVLAVYHARKQKSCKADATLQRRRNYRGAARKLGTDDEGGSKPGRVIYSAYRCEAYDRSDPGCVPKPLAK